MRRPASTPPELRGYSYQRLLGSGGFSDVFLYDQELPKRRVAVKVLLLDEITPASRAAFVAEANLMAQLSAHPYIVTIYHADVADDDRPYFVMEYCSGPSLAERYKQAPFAVADALRTGVRLSSAVHTAHLAGILHRDIKPGNVLGNDYGWPALTDFGISSAVDDALPTHTTTVQGALADTSTGGTSGQVGLSVPWSPPEMFEDDPSPDVRSDVFSLAATIWTVLAGQTPFEVRGRSNGTLDLIGRIERGAITPMERTDIPRSLIAVLQKGMATEREDRFSSALDFGRALQRVEMELGYARTELEVPNLHLETPERPADTGGDDETRVRQVATIEAQPVAVAAAAPEVDETRVRSAATVEAQPVPPAARVTAPPAPVAGAGASTGAGAGAGTDSLQTETVVRPRGPAALASEPDVQPAEPRSKRGRIVGIVVGAVAAIVVAAVVVGIVLFGGTPPDEEGTTLPSTEPTAAVPDTVPTPELAGEPTAQGSVVTFPVTSADPQEGDLIVWQSARADEPQLHPVEGDQVVVDGYVEGTPLCIDISLRREGRLSSPLTVCYPSA